MSIDCGLFLDALDEYIDAKKDRDEARGQCDAEWGYYGYRFEERLQDARNKVSRALTEIIEATTATSGAANGR